MKIQIEIILPDKTKKLVKFPGSIPHATLRSCIISFCKYEVSNEVSMREDFYPCMTCKGKAWVYTEEPDPYEGNKLRAKGKCPTCNATGNGNKKEWMDLYKKKKVDLECKLRIWHEKASATQNTLNEFSAEQWSKIEAARDFLGMP